MNKTNSELIDAVSRAFDYSAQRVGRQLGYALHLREIEKGRVALADLEEQLQSLEREAEIQNDEAERLHEQLDALAKIGYELVYDNMHFHERAMADPFEAESYVQGEGQRILDVTGLPSNVTVVSTPAREPESA